MKIRTSLNLRRLETDNVQVEKSLSSISFFLKGFHGGIFHVDIF